MAYIDRLRNKYETEENQMSEKKSEVVIDDVPKGSLIIGRALGEGVRITVNDFTVDVVLVRIKNGNVRLAINDPTKKSHIDRIKYLKIKG